MIDIETPPEDAPLPQQLSRWQQQFQQGDLVQRREAVEALYELARELGAQAAAALPTLQAALAVEDEHTAESASWAMSYLAPASLVPLMQALGHPWAAVRRRAAHALGNIHEAAMPACPALRGLLADADVEVACRAAWALGLIGDTSSDTLAALWRMAEVGAMRHRGAALHALGNLGRRLDDSTAWVVHRPLLMAALEDADGDVRWSALYAAEQLPLSREEWVVLLGTRLARETSDRVADAVMHRLKGLAPVADLSPLLPELIRRLGLPGPRALHVCEVLGAMRPPPLEALPALRVAMAGDNVPFHAARAIWRIQPDAAAVLPVLDRLFDGHDEEVCDLVCEMGPAAAPLLPRLLAAMGSEVWDVQWAVADALAAVAPDDAESQRVLLLALGHDSPLVRSGAARALAQSGALHVPVLARLLADLADTRAAWAAFALGLIGPAAAQALGELRKGMRGADPVLAQACQIAVARIGSTDSVDLLIEMLADPQAGPERAAAAEALGMLGPAARPARRALEALVHDADANVADAASSALAQMGVTH